MKTEEFNNIIRTTPKPLPVFRVTKTFNRYYAQLGVKKGDLFARHPTDCWIPIISACTQNIGLHPSEVQFHDFADLNNSGRI